MSTSLVVLAIALLTALQVIDRLTR